MHRKGRRNATGTVVGLYDQMPTSVQNNRRLYLVINNKTQVGLHIVQVQHLIGPALVAGGPTLKWSSLASDFPL